MVVDDGVEEMSCDARRVLELGAVIPSGMGHWFPRRIW
jgi:hypothetical protein